MSSISARAGLIALILALVCLHETDLVVVDRGPGGGVAQVRQGLHHGGRGGAGHELQVWQVRRRAVSGHSGLDGGICVAVCRSSSMDMGSSQTMAVGLTVCCVHGAYAAGVRPWMRWTRSSRRRSSSGGRACSSCPRRPPSRESHRCVEQVAEVVLGFKLSLSPAALTA